MGATGFAARHCPAGAELDELLHVARIGQAFAAQHRGRRPGFLAQYVAELVRERQPATFHQLLVELRFLAARTAQRGHGVVIAVDMQAGAVTYIDPRRGERDVSLKRIRNLAGLRKNSPACR